MQSRPFEAGDGTVYTLDRQEELDTLPAALRALPSRRMLQVWTGSPSSLEEMASRTGHPPLASFLRHVARRRCALEIYDTAPVPDGFGRAALLALDADGARPVRIDLSRPRRGRAPIRTPEALDDVHAAIGGLCFELGGSGSLVPPGELGPLDHAWPGVAAWLDEAGGELAHDLREILPELHPFFESSGDFAVFRAGHEDAYFIGVESGAVRHHTSFATVLGRLFEELEGGVRPEPARWFER